ncbi:MAG: hypothetical protein KatS3mg053_3870 [Candidatus Roseilinea sp.]|nr:MAG: hypothetical protein KatS3mg053_3870 [Candidatus Roseilinea sp.]
MASFAKRVALTAVGLLIAWEMLIYIYFLVTNSSHTQPGDTYPPAIATLVSLVVLNFIWLGPTFFVLFCSGAWLASTVLWLAIYALREQRVALPDGETPQGFHHWFGQKLLGRVGWTAVGLFLAVELLLYIIPLVSEYLGGGQVLDAGHPVEWFFAFNFSWLGVIPFVVLLGGAWSAALVFWMAVLSLEERHRTSGIGDMPR